MKKYFFIFSSFIVIISILTYIFLIPHPTKLDMTYPSFMTAVTNNQVKNAYLSPNDNFFQVELVNKPNILYRIPNPKTDNFTEYLLLHNITVQYGNENALLNAFRIFVIVLIIGAMIYLSKKGNPKNFNIFDSNKNKNKENKELITLDQVAGNVEAKSMVQDIIDFIKDPEKYSDVGARMPRGLLFYGPPGTGKTLLAKAIAGEANVPFYAMSGSDFVQMYVGVGASRIRNLFQKAKKNEKAVIFIDEIDAIGKHRARSASASNDERDQTLNALLTEMSGFHENKGIIVIGATNRLDTLDEALLRPGRFDRQIEINLPDFNSRQTILTHYAKQKPISDDVNLEALSKSTVYFSGAMLENLLNEAAINAANDSNTVITQEHIDRAFYTILAGSPKMDLSFLTDKDKKITAYHEAGHALATKILQPEHFISKVTIIPSVRGTGGFNLSIPSDTQYQTKEQIIASIQVLLAGRAAEELIFGSSNITTGASNDIQKASSLILNYINKFGMDQDMGLFSMDVLEKNYDNQLVNRCREHINDLYDKTLSLLTNNQELLEQITAELIEKESLNHDDIKRICA
ncbi:ATP-dependent metallopeptidase FtsH/Yme1/Tma family protein [Anaeromicropila herbilytica]|uniref:Cell division protein FtsH n=1 Tax=Anaeromicropila herbilytica TaxID=2785025 RepID=A0A7R7EKV5_9FIRM|nr:AAA family ATPase [Anaeromicropila herbilytica]BCN30317.1 cell division protein FtsH [Anaeromicropila herbilytica]